MQEFKVGQKLKKKEIMWVGLGTYPVIENAPSLTVSKVITGRYPALMFEETSSFPFDSDYFELVEEKPKRFAVGNKVISTRGTPEVPEGFVGYIVEHGQKNYDYAVESLGIVEYFNEDELELLTGNLNKKVDGIVTDAVHSPKHYAIFEQLEAIEVIASSMTTDQFYGYCLGNILKYRLRAGGKDDVMQELGKADKYQELFSKFKSLCKDAV